MTDKLTDNEIVKALECCDGDFDRCYECPYDNADNNKVHCWDLEKDALDLINRLQAKLDEAEDTIQFADKELKKANTEIERLKSDVSVSRDAYMSMEDRYEYEKEKVKKAKQKCIDIGKALKNAKTEAYKEFAEKLKKKYKPYVILGSEVAEIEIDNLLKELAGENNETKTF